MSTDATPEPPGTFDDEAGLPRVPLPSVEESCARFLEWCAPLLDEGQLAETRAAVEAFAGGADEVHAALAEYAGRPDMHSWLDEFWEDRYLGRRDRIALNANFFFLFNDTDDDQISRAVRLIIASAGLKLALDAGTAPVVRRRGQPQSMVEHKYLFGSTRIPGVVRDTARTPYTAEHPGPSTARHIVVFFRGSAFRLDVIGPAGVPHSPEELAQGLRTITATAPARGRWVGALTTKARAEWARSRAALLAADPGNPATLDVLETALFCVALEDRQPAGIEAKCKTLLAGDSANRWFDKSVTFIVFPDGSAGINGEHCRLDGTAIVEFVDTVTVGTVEEHAARSGARPQGNPEPTPLEFVLTDELVADVETAAREFDAYADATATRCLTFDGIGSNLAKSLKISPDAFVQLAFQLAHKRSKGFAGATYESINTRHFHHGRTEAMRVVTPEIVEFVAAMDDPMADRAARAAALRKAAEQHVTRAKECQAGDAPEQHLWELQLLARRLGKDWDPELYRSPGWTIMRDDYLSTSAAPSVNIQYFGFGATSTHCIGVAYLLLPDTFNVHLSTPASVAAEMAAFADRLAEALTELTGLLRADLAYWPADTSEPILELTTGDLLRQAAADSGDRTAIIEVADEGDRRWTYDELLAEAEQCAYWLLTRFSPGERITVWAPNIPEWMILQYGAALAGIVLVTANPALRAEELRYVLTQSRSAGLFRTDAFRGSDMTAIADEATEGLAELRETISFTDWDATVRAHTGRGPLPDVQPGDAAQIQYTSGTTGFPKGALLHHRGLVTNARFMIDRSGLPAGGVYVSPMPLFHTAGCAMGVLGCAHQRAAYGLCRLFEPGLVLRATAELGADMFAGVPTMLIAMLNHPEFANADLSRLSLVLTGGSPIPPELVNRIEERLGVRFSAVYGQTELSPTITQTGPADTPEDRAGTAGRPLPQMELVIRDPATGATVPYGEVGEVCVRGYQVMLGYFEMPERTAETIDAEGWLHTGDLGVLEERGYLRITGRLKDMIIRGGENIYAAEIEQVLFTHESVRDVAVLGLPDDTWGEIVAAVVVPDGAADPDPADLHALCRTHLAPHKTPKRWFRRDDLPLTGSGKIQKFRLRELIEAGDLTELPMDRRVP